MNNRSRCVCALLRTARSPIKENLGVGHQNLKQRLVIKQNQTQFNIPSDDSLYRQVLLKCRETFVTFLCVGVAAATLTDETAALQRQQKNQCPSSGTRAVFTADFHGIIASRQRQSHLALPRNQKRVQGEPVSSPHRPRISSQIKRIPD